MTLTPLRRSAVAVAAVAVVATTAGAAALPALATADPGPAATSLSIRALKDAIRPGGTDAIAGTLAVAGPLTGAGRTVTLEARPMGATGFTPIGVAVAGTHNAVREAVTPSVTTRYRWHYAGDADTRPSVSGVATVRVRTPQHPPTRIPTTLSIRAVHRLVGLDGADVVRGRLRAGRVPLRHRPVILVSRTANDTGWTFDGVHRTRRDGVVAFRVAPTEGTAYRLAFLGTTLLQPTHSATVRVAIRPSVSITADPTRIDRGETTTVSGVVTEGGTPVDAATVRLLARRVGTTHPWHVAGSGTTATDGSVGFTESPAGSTSYRLRLVAGAGYPGAVSGRATVVVRTPTSLSIRGRDSATAFVVSGTLLGGGHPLAARPVTLWQQGSSGTWTQTAAGSTNAHGVVRFAEPPTAGTGYRLAYAGGPRFAPSTSGTVIS
jgi:hypothetical protein